MSGVSPHPSWAKIWELERQDPFVAKVCKAFLGTVRDEELLILMVVELARERARLVAELTEVRIKKSPVMMVRIDPFTLKRGDQYVIAKDGEGSFGSFTREPFSGVATDCEAERAEEAAHTCARGAKGGAMIAMGPYDGVEPDDVDDPGFDPADYWNDVCDSGDDTVGDEEEE